MTGQLLAAFRQTLLAALVEPIVAIDAGARWGADAAFTVLKDHATVYCFDPDAAECARLQALETTGSIHYVPLALSSDGRRLGLHVTREPACSSIYPPDPGLHANYPGLGIIEAVSKEYFDSVSVDSYLGARDCGALAWLKLDTQGSELDILQGSVGHLSTVCMIDVEVEFNPLYVGQPVFSDVDRFLRAHGFALWRLPLLAHYATTDLAEAGTPIRINSSPRDQMQTTHPGNGQLFWAQAHYVRADCLPASSSVPETQQALKTAVIASAYGYWDLTLLALAKCPGTSEHATAMQALLAPSQG